MADEIVRPDLSAFPARMGGWSQPTPVLPSRSWTQAAGDTALDVIAGGVGVARGIGGFGDFVQTAIDTKPPTEHPKMDALADIQAGLLNERSANARYIDEAGGPSITREFGRYATHVGTGMLPYAPLAVLGPWGAIPAAAIAFGNEQSEDIETARSADMSQNPKYQTLLRYGLSDQEARARLLQEVSDPSDPATYGRRAAATAGQAVGWGATRAGFKAVRGTMANTRKISDEITDNVLKSTGGAWRGAAAGAGAGAGAGAMMGAGTDYSRQASEVAMGQRREVDPWQVAEAAVEPTALLGGLGAVGGGLHRARQVAARRGATEVRDEVPPKGTDVMAVAGEEAMSDQPLLDRPTTPQEQYDTPPPRPPGRFNVPVPGERSPVDITPPEPGAPRPPGFDPSIPSTHGPGPHGIGEPAPLPGEHVVTPEAPLSPRFPEMDRPNPYGGFEFDPGEPMVERPTTPYEQYDRRVEHPPGREPTPREVYDRPERDWEPISIEPTNRPPTPDETYDVPPVYRPPTPREVYDRPEEPWAPGGKPTTPGDGTPPLATLKAALPAADLAELNKATKAMVDKGVTKIVAARLPAKTKEVLKTLPPEVRQGVVDAYREQARETVDFMNTGLREGDGLARSTEEEGSAAKARPKRTEAQDGRQEEAGEAQVVPADRAGAQPEREAAGTVAKGKSKVAEVNEKIRERLSEKVTGEGKTLRESTALQKLKERLENEPEADPVEAAKKALEDAAETPEVRVNEYVENAMAESKRVADRRRFLDTERKKKRTKPLRDIRESIVKKAFRNPIGRRRVKSLNASFEGMLRLAAPDAADPSASTVMKATSLYKAVPKAELEKLAGRLVEGMNDYIKRALVQLEQHKTGAGTEARQIGWDLPRKRPADPWFNALYDMELLKNALVRTMDKSHFTGGEGGPARLHDDKVGLAKYLMTDVYLLHRAIEMDRLDLWKLHKIDDINTIYDQTQRKIAGAKRAVDNYDRMKALIDEVDAKLKDTAKPIISQEQMKQYELAKVNYGDGKKRAQRAKEVETLQRRLQFAAEIHGLDPLSTTHEDANFDDRLIAKLDAEEWKNENRKDPLQFMFDNLVRPEEAAMIERARAEKRIDEVEKKTGVLRPANDEFAPIRPGSKGERFRIAARDVIKPAEPRHDYTADRPRKENAAEAQEREAKASKRTMEVEDEATRIVTALDALPDENTKNVAHVVDTLHEALGDPNLKRSHTEENAQFLRDYADERMRELENEQRGLAEQANPRLLNNEYSIKRVLDPTADLKVRSNLPSGAYVRPVSDFLKPGRTLSGLDTSVRPAGEGREAMLANHIFNVVEKVGLGRMDVVGLTAEQMRLAAEARYLPGDTPAFYDPAAGRIFISHDVGRPGSPEFRRTLGHEIVHPLSELAIENFPETGNRIDSVRKLLAAEVYKGDTKAAEIMNGRVHGLENVHEFLSELFNDGGVIQRALDTIPSGRRSKEGGFASALARLKDFIGDGLRKLFLRETHRTALSDAMVHSLDLFRAVEQARAQDLKPVRGTTPRPMAAEQHIEATKDWVRTAAGRAAAMWARADGRNGIAMWAHDLSQQARRAEPGMQERVEAVRHAHADSYTGNKRIMEESHTPEIAEQIAKAMNLNPQAWERFQKYYDRENQSQVSGSDPIGKGLNSWIDPKSKAHAQFRAEHAELAKEYKLLSEPFTKLRATLRKSYDDRHEAMAKASMEQLVEINQMAPDAATASMLAKWLRDRESSTPAELAHLEQKVLGFSDKPDRSNKTPEYAAFRKQTNEIRAIEHLKKVPGVWYPKFRSGEWVVEGEFNLDTPATKHGGTKLDGTRGTYDFPTEAARDKFMEDLAADPALRQVKFRGLDDIKNEDGTTTYRARYNPLTLSFFEGKNAAFEEHAGLAQAYGDKIKLTHVEPRRDEHGTYLNPVKADRALKAMMDSLHKSVGWKDLDAASQRRLERDMNEAAVRHIMSTSARATYLPRDYALGSRKDVMRDFLEYMVNTGYSLAELRNRNQLKTAYRELDDYVDSMKHAGSPGDPQGKFGVLRRQLQESLHRRADYRPDPILSPLWKKSLARVLQLSYLDKLVSPMNWVLNATEPLMSGGPMLAGVHGARAYVEIFKAYKDMGFSRYLDGFKDAKTVYEAGVGNVPRLPDNPLRFKEATAHLPDAKEIHQMIDYLERLGHLDRDSSMEVGRIFDPSAGKGWRTVDWGDNITRQISANIDNVNRVALGMAALRMARSSGKGGGLSMEAALAHAEKYVGKMAGNYAKYNEAEMFRHVALGPMMQFKRYAQRMTANWLGVVYHSFAKDVPPETKEIARRQLMYMSGTLLFMSGALGLPTEPIKGVINAFSPLTGYDSEDVENDMRQGASNLLGKDLGYAMTRGVPRAFFNMGIGTRLGLDSMWTQGAPGDKPDSWYASIGRLVGGAPLGGMIEAGSGALRLASATGNMARGRETEAWNDLRHGVQLMVPIKAFADTIDAAANAFGGPTTRTRYGQPLGYQPSGVESAMTALGMRSGESQERGDARRAVSAATSRMTSERNQIYAAYVHASTPAEKRLIFEQARDGFNKRWTPELAITIGDLIRAERSYRKKIDTNEDRPDMAGLTLSRRQQSILPRFSAYDT